jgi:hypothetical protein
MLGTKFLTKNEPPVIILTPPHSVAISHVSRGTVVANHHEEWCILFCIHAARDS